MAVIRDRYILELDTTGATQALNSFKTALGVVVSAAAVREVINITSRFEDLQTSLNTVTGSAEAGARAFQTIRQFAATTQFGVEELTQTYIQLRAAGIEPTERLLRTFADTAAVTTDQIGSLEAMSALLARTTGGGLGLEELERLADRGIPVYKILEEQIGLTRQEISEFGQTAEGARTIVEALLRGLNENFGGATAAKLENLSTVMSNFSDSITATIAAFGTGLSPAIKEIITDLTNFLNNNEDVARALGEVSGEALKLIADAVRELAESLGLLTGQGIRDVFADLIVGLGEFLVGFENVTNTILRGLNNIGNAIAQFQSITNGTVILPSGTNNIDAYVESLKSMRDRLIEMREEQGFLSNALENSFVRSLLGSAGVAAETFTQQIDDLNEKIAAIESGNYFVELEDNISGAASSTESFGQKLIDIGEKLRQQVDFYPDAIFRIAEAQRRAAEAAGGVVVTPTGEAPAVPKFTPPDPGFAEFYNRIIERSQATVNETTYAQQAIEALNESLRFGVISPQVYSEAMAQINEQLAQTQEGTATVASVMADLNAQMAEQAANSTIQQEIFDQLNQQYLTGAIGLDYYKEAVRSLGGSFEEQMAAAGNYMAYIEDLKASIEDSIAADEFKQQVIDNLTAAFESGAIGPDMYAEAMRRLGEEVQITADGIVNVIDEMDRLNSAAGDILGQIDERVARDRERAELSGLTGIQRELRSIELEERRLAEAAKERLQTQFGEGVDTGALREQFDAIDRAAAAAIAERQRYAREIEGNNERLRESQRSLRENSDSVRRSSEALRRDSEEFRNAWLDRLIVRPEDVPSFLRNGSGSTGIGAMFGGLTEGIKSAVGAVTAPIYGPSTAGGAAPAGDFAAPAESATTVINNAVTYNINAVDALSFKQLLARDPAFIHSLVERAKGRIPGGR